MIPIQVMVIKSEDKKVNLRVYLSKRGESILKPKGRVNILGIVGAVVNASTL
ncbi:MAG: hypothetical protein HYY52_03315 [Candidatus Melainabacteria bacterium]|nr:hypothetical protein [Candidatus Melainabacteria bacterium]